MEGLDVVPCKYASMDLRLLPLKTMHDPEDAKATPVEPMQDNILKQDPIGALTGPIPGKHDLVKAEIALS